MQSSTKTTSSHALPRWLWWVGMFYMGITLITYIAALPVRYRDLLEIQSEPIAILQLAIEYLFIVVSFSVSGLLMFKRSDERIAVLTAVILPATVPNLISLSYLSTQLHPIFYIGAGIVFVPGPSILFLFITSLPDGEVKPHWLLWIVPPLLIYDFFRYLIFFVFGSLEIQAIRPTAFMISIFVMLFGIIIMINRYRHHSTPIQRQQFKWLFISLIISAILLIIIQTLRLISLRSGGTMPDNSLFSSIIVTTSGIIICISLLMAIFKYGLWDIDLTINRSLVASIVTVVLVILFGIFFLISQRALAIILGNEQNELAVGVSALVIGGAFSPVRLRARSFVDRRLYGFRFDLNQLHRHKEKVDVKNPGALTGKTLGGYELLDVLGRGGMGEVYKGFGDDQLVAVKILQHDHSLDQIMRQRFTREGKITLNHPNIVKTLRAGESDNIFYLIMDYVEGQTLKDIISQNQVIYLDTVWGYITDLADAIDYAHAQGYIHRDIKPSNIMLCLNPDRETYKVVLMDFGIAKFLGDTSSLTGSAAVGTIDYMAPEQIMDSTAVDYRADIYALGVVLYQVLSGALPFSGSLAQVLFAHVNQPAPDIRQLRPDLPLEVSDAIHRALQKNPDDRFQSAKDFVNALTATI
jgi:tRNA A-37 threonylcarbamoyl transferase component Bud32